MIQAGWEKSTGPMHHLLHSIELSMSMHAWDGEMGQSSTQIAAMHLPFG